MSNNNILTLLQTRRFLPLFICQALSAFKHNFLRTLLVAIVTFKSLGLSDLSRSLLVSLSFGITNLPYILFSATAGELADKYNKAKLIQISKILDFALTFIVILGIYVSNYTLILLIGFLISFEATIMGPVKYSILPEHLNIDELIVGNGLIEASTFLAILLGIISGGMVQSDDNITIIILLFATATVAYLASLFIPGTKPAVPDLKVDLNIFSRSMKIIGLANKDPYIYKLIIIISWFWLEGGIFLAQLPNFTKDVLKADKSVFVLLITIFTCGVAVGSLVCYKILKKESQIRYSLYSLFISSMLLGILCYITSYLPAQDISVDLQNFTSLFAGLAICILLFFVASFYGVFIVPIYVLLQIRAENKERSRIIAANNIINAIFIAIGSLISTALIFVGISVTNIFLLLIAANMLVIWYGMKLEQVSAT